MCCFTRHLKHFIMMGVRTTGHHLCWLWFVYVCFFGWMIVLDVEHHGVPASTCSIVLHLLKFLLVVWMASWCSSLQREKSANPFLFLFEEYCLMQLNNFLTYPASYLWTLEMGTSFFSQPCIESRWRKYSICIHVSMFSHISCQGGDPLDIFLLFRLRLCRHCFKTKYW